MTMLDELKLAADNLRAAISEHHAAETAVLMPPVSAPGLDPNMPEKLRVEATRLYTEAILAKEPGQITAADRAFLHAGIREYERNGGN